MKYKFFISALLLGGLWSCQPEINEFEPSKGNADFSVYMTAGNSLTAGYADNALYKSGQENSFSNMLAEQMEYVGAQAALTFLISILKMALERVMACYLPS